MVRCLAPLRRAFLLRRLQRAGVRRGRTFGELTPRVYRQYAALFCHPRRVVLPCTPGGRVFPIDLHGLNPETGAAVLGVRQGSAAVAELLDTRALALCDVAGHHRPDVYALGKMGGQPTAAAMAGGRRTRHVGIAVPHIAAGGTEVPVTHDVELGLGRRWPRSTTCTSWPGWRWPSATARCSPVAPRCAPADDPGAAGRGASPSGYFAPAAASTNSPIWSKFM